MDKIITTKLSQIYNQNGDIFHCIKNGDEGFTKFGEVYLSEIKYGKVKAWKRHKEMVCNIIVTSGKVLFVMHDNRDRIIRKTSDIILSKDNFHRLTIPPNVWFGFKGLSKVSQNLIMNVASIKHDPLESEKCQISTFPYNWDWRK